MAIYAAVAGLWIFASDHLLGALVHDPDALLDFSVLKGLAFVAATAGLLYGMLRRTLGTVEDTLAAMAHAQAQRQQEQHFADTLIEAMPGVFYLHDERGRFLRWNRNFERVSGYSAEEIATMSPLDFFSETDKWRVGLRIEEVFAVGESSAEAELATKLGTATPYFFTGKRIALQDSKCLVAVGVDLAARKRAEEALIRSEARYRTTLDSILEGCQLLDFDWRYLYLNAAAATQNRRPNPELLGNRMPDVWPGIEATPVFALLERCMRERISVHEEIEFAFPDGTSGWFDLRSQPVREGIFASPRCAPR